MGLTVKAEYPEKLLPLLEPAPYKIVYGGRGGLKSWTFAQALLILGAQRPLRILCTRETQRSIADSVHALLSDWVKRLELQRFYTIQQATITGQNGTSFIFAGLKEIDSIKSAEGIDICWVEEAQNVPNRSWEKLIPTIRKKGAEIWVSYNPELETDETHVRFVLNPPTGAVVIKTTWRDNPWFYETRMPADMQDLRERDHQAYLHVWEGETRSAVEGAIYAAEIATAEAENRIGRVVCDRTKPVHTFWDLGFSDETAIWFVQVFGSEYRVIDYLQAHGKTIEWYLIQLQQRQYVYGTDWLPHDGVDAMIHGRLSGDQSRSVEQLMRAAGRNVRIAPKMLVATGINAARTIFPQCWFDRDACAEGLRALKSYQWGPASAHGVLKREPLHDWASHGADAFRTLAIAHPLERPKVKERKPDDFGFGRQGDRYTFMG